MDPATSLLSKLTFAPRPAPDVPEAATTMMSFVSASPAASNGAKPSSIAVA